MRAALKMFSTLKAVRAVNAGRVTLGKRYTIARHLSETGTGFISLKEPFQPEVYVDLKNQSFLIPGPERIRATMLTRNPKQLIYEVPGTPHVKTVFDTVCHGLKISNDGPCAGMKNKETNLYEWINYSEVIERAKHVGSALMEKGLKPRSNSYVGVFAGNRTEFLLTLFGCAGYSLVLVPLYDSLGVKSVNFIIKQADMPLVIANNCTNALNVLSSVEEMPFLKTIVIMDTPSEEVISAARSSNIHLLTFAEFEVTGKRAMKELVLPDPEDLFCIVYTSGTTGTPKGAMLTHRNMMACLSSLIYGYGPVGTYGGTIVSYLPAAHVYEMMNYIGSTYFARRLAFIQLDVTRLFDDIREAKPNVITLVPRLMNAFYSKVMEQIKSSKVKSAIFHFAILRKQRMLLKGIVSRNTIWDKLVFKKIQDALGGDVQMVATSSAAVSPEVMRFFRCAAGCYVFEMYGQTEVLASTMTLPHETEGGSVGPPLPCNFIKLIDVPEMNYFAVNDEGEICYKGHNVFKGYFKSPEQTKECLDEEGWHRSGDIGRWMPNGTLKIIDRKKHIFKLSQGEYIAPEKVESAYSQSNLVMQIFVDGFPTEDYPVAVVVPEQQSLMSWAESKGYHEPFQTLIQNKEFRTAVLRELHTFGKKAELNALEQARSITIISEPFTVQNGMLSPTLKLKRNLARKHYHQTFESMYKEGPLISSSK